MGEGMKLLAVKGLSENEANEKHMESKSMKGCLGVNTGRRIVMVY